MATWQILHLRESIASLRGQHHRLATEVAMNLADLKGRLEELNLRLTNRITLVAEEVVRVREILKALQVVYDEELRRMGAQLRDLSLTSK